MPTTAQLQPEKDVICRGGQQADPRCPDFSRAKLHPGHSIARGYIIDYIRNYLRALQNTSTINGNGNGKLFFN
jgi:hypothetical protein